MTTKQLQEAWTEASLLKRPDRPIGICPSRRHRRRYR